MDKQQESNKLGDEEELLRRGAWTIEEDITLINYIAHHGEGRWNSLASCAGLKRTGKSCRLRWVNYLRPDVSHGNITLQEQLLILQLHSQWGNKWSTIAQHLPGRTDNEIKNYWRTRVQKHAKQLNCDVDSKQFKDIVRHLWIPRLVEKIQAADGGSAPPTSVASSSVTATYQQNNIVMSCGQGFPSYTPENSRAAGCCESTTVDNNNNNQDYYPYGGDFEQNSMEQWMDGGDASESLWFLQQQFNTD